MSEGFIQSVKRSVVLALRAAFSSANLQANEEPDSALLTISNNIDMEYPVEVEKYPGIWVQFSFSSLQKAGIDPVVLSDDRMYEEQIWSFKGSVSLNIVALSSKARDRVSDAFVDVFAFAQPTSDIFWTTLTSYPEISVSVNRDTLRPMGQSTTVGTPWAPDLLAYEDAYAFEVQGYFKSHINSRGQVVLSRIDVVPEMNNSLVPGEWV